MRMKRFGGADVMDNADAMLRALAIVCAVLFALALGV
jgi:hypothetical protein